MYKWIKIILSLLAFFLCVSFLHVWLNIGFDKLGFAGQPVNKFRVGFLPVT